MSEKFITAHPLPTPYEREILTIMIEECAEVAQRATKLLRFGRDEVQDGQDFTNRERLSAELGDLAALVELAKQNGLLHMPTLRETQMRKREKLVKYMQTRPEDVG